MLLETFIGLISVLVISLLLAGLSALLIRLIVKHIGWKGYFAVTATTYFLTAIYTIFTLYQQALNASGYYTSF